MSIRPTIDGKFPKLDLPFYGDVSLGNSTQYKVGMFKTVSGRLFVGVEGKPCYTFGNWCHYSYAAEKLGLRFEGDARNIADFINSQLGHDLSAEGEKCQGTYDTKLCVGDIFEQMTGMP